MKNRYKSAAFYGLLACASFNFVACGPQIDLMPWEIIDEAQNGEDGEGGISSGDVSLEVLEGELLSGLPLMLDFNTHKYQYQRANNIDVFAGYFMVAHSVFDYGRPLLHTYDFPNGYYGGPMGESKKMYPQIYHAYFFGEKHGVPEWKALAQIAYAYNMQGLTDIYGPVPYDDFRNRKETPPLTYISTQDAYSRILADLEEAISILKEAKPTAEALKRVEGPEGGLSDLDWRKWVKFANSIRLRMALNMVKVDPARAQALAEDAVNDEIGVLEYNDTDFQMTMNGNPQHPLYQICKGWDDSRLGASLENIMKRYENPLLDKWFEKNSGPIESNGVQMLNTGLDYVGIRQGTSVDSHITPKGYKAFSIFKDRYMPRTYLKVTEVLFNRAEGALRGWAMGGTAQSFYEQGIRKSFEENNVSGYDEYITREEVEEVDYVDYYKTEYSTEGRVTVGVAWDDTDTDETKLEKIITQKYIAIFPASLEAWTTFRRTGYPRLIPVIEKNSWADGSFDVELQIRRIPYSTSGTATDNANIAAVEAVIGNDSYPDANGSLENTAGVRLWWDKPTESRVDGDPKGKIIPKNF